MEEIKNSFRPLKINGKFITNLRILKAIHRIERVDRISGTFDRFL